MNHKEMALNFLESDKTCTAIYGLSALFKACDAEKLEKNIELESFFSCMGDLLYAMGNDLMDMEFHVTNHIKNIPDQLTVDPRKRQTD